MQIRSFNGFNKRSVAFGQKQEGEIIQLNGATRPVMLPPGLSRNDLVPSVYGENGVTTRQAALQDIVTNQQNLAANIRDCKDFFPSAADDSYKYTISGFRKSMAQNRSNFDRYQSTLLAIPLE